MLLAGACYDGIQAYMPTHLSYVHMRIDYHTLTTFYFDMLQHFVNING